MTVDQKCTARNNKDWFVNVGMWQCENIIGQKDLFKIQKRMNLSTSKIVPQIENAILGAPDFFRYWNPCHRILKIHRLYRLKSIF